MIKIVERTLIIGRCQELLLVVNRADNPDPDAKRQADALTALIAACASTTVPALVISDAHDLPQIVEGLSADLAPKGLALHSTPWSVNFALDCLLNQIEKWVCTVSYNGIEAMVTIPVTDDPDAAAIIGRNLFEDDGLDLPESVSRSHCLLRQDPSSSQLLIFDQSRNGVYNGENLISEKQWLPVQEGNILTLVYPLGHDKAVNLQFHKVTQYDPVGEAKPAIHSAILTFIFREPLDDDARQALRQILSLTEAWAVFAAVEQPGVILKGVDARTEQEWVITPAATHEEIVAKIRQFIQPFFDSNFDQEHQRLLKRFDRIWSWCDSYPQRELAKLGADEAKKTGQKQKDSDLINHVKSAQIALDDLQHEIGSLKLAVDKLDRTLKSNTLKTSVPIAVNNYIRNLRPALSLDKAGKSQLIFFDECPDEVMRSKIETLPPNMAESEQTRRRQDLHERLVRIAADQCEKGYRDLWTQLLDEEQSHPDSLCQKLTTLQEESLRAGATDDQISQHQTESLRALTGNLSQRLADLKSRQLQSLQDDPRVALPSELAKLPEEITARLNVWFALGGVILTLFGADLTIAKLFSQFYDKYPALHFVAAAIVVMIGYALLSKGKKDRLEAVKQGISKEKDALIAYYIGLSTDTISTYNLEFQSFLDDVNEWFQREIACLNGKLVSRLSEIQLHADPNQSSTDKLKIDLLKTRARLGDLRKHPV